MRQVQYGTVGSSPVEHVDVPTPGPVVDADVGWGDELAPLTSPGLVGVTLPFIFWCNVSLQINK
jgi:hypothetical protein